MIRKWKWKEVGTSALDKAISTDHAQRLSNEDMPTWTRTSQAITAALLFPEARPPLDSTGALSTEGVHGQILVERQYLQSPRFRYDMYLLARINDGRVFQLGPYKNVEFGHHHDQRPDWLEKLISTR